MNKTLIITLAIALALAGCIQNMGDLKDRLGATTEESLEPADIAPEATLPDPVENTTPAKPPVARITVFGPNGALVYKSTFTAEDPTDVVFVEENSKLSLNAGESESLEPGASVTGFAWSLDGKPVAGGRSANVDVGEPGLYTLSLAVTDSAGSTDTQTLKLGVAPKAFEVVTDLVTAPVVGAQGQGEAGTVGFALAIPGDTPAMVQSVTFELLPVESCDAILDVLDAEGTSLGTKDGGSFGEGEKLSAGALALGEYTISASPFVCAAPEGVPARVTVVYMPIIEGLDTDGHGHAH